MLKRTIIPLLLGSGLYAASLLQLLNGVRHHYQAQIDSYSIEESNRALKMVKGQFWPKIRLFGTIAHYNSPSNLRPTTPTESNEVAPDFPFSRTIKRVGATLSMPIFVSQLFYLADKAKAMRRLAVAKKEVDLLKDQATVIGANANLRYLEESAKALQSKIKTLRTSEKIIKAKIKAGRAPASALYKLQERYDAIRIALDNIAVQKENICMLIATLSGINLRHSVPMRLRGRIKRGALLPLKPLKAKLQADKAQAIAEEKKLYPSLHLDANINRSYGKSYASGKDIPETTEAWA